jgi:hypothetical protein
MPMLQFYFIPSTMLYVFELVILRDYRVTVLDFHNMFS